MAASLPPVLVVEPPSLKTLDLFYPPWTRMSHLIAMHLCLCLLPEMGPLSMEAPGLWLPFQEELLCGMGQLSLSYPELHQSLLKRIQRSTPPPLLRDVDTVTRELERLPQGHKAGTPLSNTGCGHEKLQGPLVKFAECTSKLEPWWHCLSAQLCFLPRPMLMACVT